MTFTCLCGCGGEGGKRLGKPSMTLAQLQRKLRVCIVPKAARDKFLSKWVAAGNNIASKKVLLNASRMASQHKVGRCWGPVTRTEAGTLRPAPSPVTRMHNGGLTFSSPMHRTPSPAFLALREALVGPESVKSFQYAASGCFKPKVSSSQKKAIRAQRAALEILSAENDRQAAYTGALEESLRVEKANAPAWTPLARAPGAFSPGVTWDRVKGSPGNVILMLTGFPSAKFVILVYDYFNCHGGLCEGNMYNGDSLREAPPQLPPIPAGKPPNHWETHFIPKGAYDGYTGKPRARALQGIDDFFHFLYICRDHTHEEAAFMFGISTSSSSNHFVHMVTRLQSAVNKYMPLTPACRAAFLCPPNIARSFGRAPTYAGDVVSVRVGNAQDSGVHRSMYSEYKSSEAVKVEGVCSALGNIEHVSVGFAGNVTDDVMLSSGPLSEMLPPASNVFIDRGYVMARRLTSNAMMVPHSSTSRFTSTWHDSSRENRPVGPHSTVGRRAKKTTRISIGGEKNIWGYARDDTGCTVPGQGEPNPLLGMLGN